MFHHIFFLFFNSFFFCCFLKIIISLQLFIIFFFIRLFIIIIFILIVFIMILINRIVPRTFICINWFLLSYFIKNIPTIWSIIRLSYAIIRFIMSMNLFFRWTFWFICCILIFIVTFSFWNLFLYILVYIFHIFEYFCHHIIGICKVIFIVIN